MPENDLAVRNLRQVHTAALRGRDLVKQILAFSRKSAPQAKPFSVTPLIRETTKLLRSTVPTTIEIREDLKAAEDTLNADPTQIQQVILNLTTNAAHAMAEGGVMTIGLDRITLDSTGPLPDPGLRPGDYLVLSVADTGTGMDETVRRKIFEPFFTTKEAGRGTGLGLSVAYGIVKAHEGAITVETAKGNGTLFRVFLPKAQGMAAADEAPRRRALQRGSASILFIDDEEAVASMAQESLSRLGYKIQAETDPEAALKEFSRDATRFDLVITDQAMPRMSGLTLAQRVLEMRPDIPVILCTGYSETVDEKTAKEAGIGAFLMKPVTREQMANAVKRALARQQGG
jgi:CheY-like chemotaxis protein